MPEASAVPVNPTDRNVTTALGMWRGHITMPSSFLSGSLLIVCGTFAFVVHLCFTETQQLRDRLRALEQINGRLIQILAPQLRIPTVPPRPESAEEAPKSK